MALNHGAERVLRMMNLATAAGRGPPSVADRRRVLANLAENADEHALVPVLTRALVLSGPGSSLLGRLYIPPDAAPAGLVYFHGGGWVAGGLETHDGLCRRLAGASGVKVLAIDYRLAPEHPFPAAVEDALAATIWAADNALQLGIDPQRLAVGGDSVGGGLAAWVAQCPAAPPLALQVLLCPILDLAHESPSRRAYSDGFFLDSATLAADLHDYCGGVQDLHDQRLSPLLAQDFAIDTPAVIHAAEYDPFRDEAEAYSERLSAAGTNARFTCWPGMIHYFYCLARAIPGAIPAVEAIGAEIRAALGLDPREAVGDPLV
jgi:acetyl esterase/lipase